MYRIADATAELTTAPCKDKIKLDKTQSSYSNQQRC